MNREELLTAIPSDIKHDYELFLAGRYPSKIKFYGGIGSRRGGVEVVLILQAWH